MAELDRLFLTKEGKGTIKGIEQIFTDDPIRPLVVMVRGEPGTAKSTFCLELMDKYLTNNPGKIGMYITFDETKGSLLRTMMALEYFEHVADTEHFQIWDMNELLKDVKKREGLMKGHADKIRKTDLELIKKGKEPISYIQTAEVLRKARANDEIICDVMEWKVYYDARIMLSELGEKLTPAKARRLILSRKFPNDVEGLDQVDIVDRIWPEDSLKPIKPIAIIDFMDTILSVIKNYIEEAGDDFAFVTIDSIQSLYDKTRKEYKKAGGKMEDVEIFLAELVDELKKLNVFTFLIGEEGHELTKKARYLVESNILLILVGEEDVEKRLIKVEKIRACKHSKKKFVFDLTNEGILILGKKRS